MATQAEHATLICPVMTQFVAEQLNGKPYCAPNACAMWRWTDAPMQLSAWISFAEGKQLEAEGWRYKMNNGTSGHCYERPYPTGMRPGGSGIIIIQQKPETISSPRWAGG